MKIKSHPDTLRSGTRRRSVIPRKTRAACKQIRAVAAAIANQVPVWDVSLFDRVTEAAPDTLTNELLKELRQTQRNAVAVGKACEEVGDKLAQAIGRVKRVLALREELKQCGRRKLDVHEEEDVEVAFDPYEVDDDAEIEVEGDDEIEVEFESKGNGKPLSVKERLARAKAKAGQ